MYLCVPPLVLNRRALKQPGTAPSAGTCSSLYHALNSASASGATFMATISMPCALAGAAARPGTICSASRRQMRIILPVTRLDHGDRLGPAMEVYAGLFSTAELSR